VVDRTTARRQVLVVGPAWVGDMVMAQSLFKALRSNDPTTAIDVLAPSWSVPILNRMREVRRAIPLAVGHGQLGLLTRWQAAKSLRKQSYERAIVLPRSAKSAIVPWLAGVPRRTGYRGEFRYGLLNDIRPINRTPTYRTVDRFVALAPDTHHAAPTNDAKNSHLPELETTPEQQAKAASLLNLHLDTPILTLCPGAEYGPAKRWPAQYFTVLANDYLARGWQVWLLGSTKDAPITRSIAEQADGVIDLAGKTTLIQAIDLLASSTLAVTNDSGLMHIAAATNTPLVALYGASDPEYTPPLSKHAEVLYLDLECSPCFKRECPLRHLNCLRQITPTHVSEALDRLTSLVVSTTAD
jgi:heptosyltransferase-2